MPKAVALFRGINVGGKNLLSMSELRRLAGALGLGDATTLLQSGNLVFDGDRRKGTALEKLLEVELARSFSLSVDCSIRTATEWEAVIAGNPFLKEAESDPGHMVVMFFKQPLVADRVRELSEAIQGPEVIRAADRELFLVYPEGIGTSKLTNAVIERKLAARGTARNWNTVTKIAAVLRAG